MMNTDRRYQTPATKPVLVPGPTATPQATAPVAPPVRIFGVRRWGRTEGTVSFAGILTTRTRW